jgi:hypothetical protein
VPRVERGNGQGVNITAVQQFAEIVVNGAILVSLAPAGLISPTACRLCNLPCAT